MRSRTRARSCHGVAPSSSAVGASPPRAPLCLRSIAATVAVPHPSLPRPALITRGPGCSAGVFPGAGVSCGGAPGDAIGLVDRLVHGADRTSEAMSFTGRQQRTCSCASSARPQRHSPKLSFTYTPGGTVSAYCGPSADPCAGPARGTRSAQRPSRSSGYPVGSGHGTACTGAVPVRFAVAGGTGGGEGEEGGAGAGDEVAGDGAGVRDVTGYDPGGLRRSRCRWPLRPRPWSGFARTNCRSRPCTARPHSGARRSRGGAGFPGRRR